MRLGNRIFIALIAALTFLTSIATVHGLPDYLCLSAKGGSMYPAIRDGDQVKVKVCVDGDLMEVGDIIVYCSIAAGGRAMYSGAMWIGHRITQKFWQDGKWYFQTKGDNCSEPDPWIVPEHFLLGKVVDIVHIGTPTQKIQEPRNTVYKPPSISYESQIWSWIWIAIFSFGAAGISIAKRKSEGN